MWADRTSRNSDTEGFVLVDRRKSTKTTRAGTQRSIQDTDDKAGQRIFGRGVLGCNGSLKSGVVLQWKSVYHVDNLWSDCTTDMLKEFVSKQQVNVLTCFEAKSLLKSEDRNQVKAFRMCADSQQTDLFTSPDVAAWCHCSTVKFKNVKDGVNA